jgi:hypothetical protein
MRMYTVTVGFRNLEHRPFPGGITNPRRAALAA